MLTKLKITQIAVLLALVLGAPLSWAVAKEIIIPGAATQAGQNISFTTLGGESIPSEAESRDEDLVVTVYFSGDAAAGSLQVGEQQFAIPGGNDSYQASLPPSRRVPDAGLYALPDAAPAFQIGWVLNEAAMDPFTSHAVELTGDGEFPVAESDDGIGLDGYYIGVSVPVGGSILSVRYQDLEGDDSYGSDIAPGAGSYAIVNDDFLGGAPGGSTGACCDTGISSWNELDLERSSFDVELSLPWSFPIREKGTLRPHLGFGFTNTELSVSSVDRFVTPGLEGVNTTSAADFDSDAYRLSVGADLVHPCGERWGTMLRLGVGVQYVDFDYGLNQNINVFTPQGGTAVEGSDSDYSVGLYGAAGVYVDVTPQIRVQAAFEFDTGFDQPAADINTTGDDLFVRNQRSEIGLDADTNYGFRVTLQAALGKR
ncbi:MAG: hypothetical protein AB8B93_16855 [Pseudomonadales bacterium]